MIENTFQDTHGNMAPFNIFFKCVLIRITAYSLETLIKR